MEKLNQYIPPLNLSTRIKAIRLWSGMGQVEFAQTMGVTQGCLSKIERGVLAPTLDNAIQIKNYFGLSIDEIIDGLINFPSIAQSFSNQEFLNLKWFKNGKIPMRFFHPLFSILEESWDNTKLNHFLKTLEIKPYFLSSNHLKVNHDFVRELIQQLGLFSWPANKMDLKNLFNKMESSFLWKDLFLSYLGSEKFYDGKGLQKVLKILTIDFGDLFSFSLKKDNLSIQALISPQFKEKISKTFTDEKSQYIFHAGSLEFIKQINSTNFLLKQPHL